MSDFLKRLSYLSTLLRDNAYTSRQLLDLLNKESFIVSQRQIQRDLKSLKYIIDQNESLNNYFYEGKKYFYIKALVKPNHNPERFKSIYTSNTRFYYQNLSVEKLKALEIIERAIHEKKTLQIQLVKDDETGENLDLDSFQFVVCPIELIHHRASYFLACYNLKKKIIEIFGIRQLEQIELSKGFTGYKKYKSLLDKEMSMRFGVTKNIDEQVYDIEIEFTSVTGRFIEDHHWHHSQKILKSKGNYVLKLRCGINRELIGWIFLWMYNVKILKPLKLKSMYEKTLLECRLTHEGETPFVYRNIFNN
ncbi:WYL domain-containing protein [Psychroflexus salinarum]|uniref:WYL domain-containing protein n=1 Tax=Psychroflexus salinarum TaxID=546024 RepID=A0ABW3GTU2_9FLAO